jgi:hypothetical protein
LDGSRIKELRADGLTVERELFLRKGFWAEGEVRLLGATVGGNFECDGGRFGGVLFADGARIQDGVFLRKGFKAEGGVRLLGATIGLGLDCHAAVFANTISNTVVLICDGATVGGSIELTKGFEAGGGKSVSEIQQSAAT